jgi:hypothetical protein
MIDSCDVEIGCGEGNDSQQGKGFVTWAARVIRI